MSDGTDYQLKKTQIMFAADTNVVELPEENFKLEVKGGDVWVFIDGKDHIVHENDVFIVDVPHKATMRKLYHRGHVKYKITLLEDNE